MAKRPFKIVIPSQPDPLNKLGNDIFNKHTADGAASPIPVLTADQLKAKLDEAAEQYAAQKNLDKEKERLNEERNLLLGIHLTQTTVTAGTVLFQVVSIRDFLLGRFRGSERKLGDWGFTVNTPKGAVQVAVPRNADKLTKLVADILKKHGDDGADSILAVFDMPALQRINDEAAKKLADAAAVNRNKEKATQARNLALGTAKGQTSKTPGTVSYFVRSVRDILLGIYRGKEQQLGDWGFEVNFNNGPTATPVPTAVPAA